MNKKSISQNLGQKFKLRPNPIVKKTHQPIKESLNSWTFLDFPDEKYLVLAHNHSNYKLRIEPVYVRGHEPPDMIVLRGQIYLDDELEFTFEPFIEGMSSIDLRYLTDDPFGRQSGNVFDALKPFQGQIVSIRFPKSANGTEYGHQEGILQEVNPHYVKVYVPEIVIDFPDWFQDEHQGAARTQRIAPVYEKSIAIGFLQLEEDVPKKRPRLVMDYSH